jgi:dolichyl-phosphate beta-glucosyltransferase
MDGTDSVFSLVLPAYNPGPAVERTWFAAAEFVRSSVDIWEIIFVLDGCTDGTAERLHSLQQSEPDAGIQVLSYAPNRGKGYAVRTGLLAASSEYRLFTDVDLAYSFDDITRLAHRLCAGAEVAIANRELAQSTLTLTPGNLGAAYRRRIQSAAFRFVTRRILPIRFSDTQAGLKGMTARVAETLLPQLTCNGFGFDCELLTACHRSGIPVAEVPVNVHYESAVSTTGFRSSLRMIRELWTVRRQWPTTRNGQFVDRTPIPAPIPLRKAA